MAVDKKIVFAVAFVTVALVAYLLFIDFSRSKFDEYEEIQRAEWIARGFPSDFYDGYAREGFLMTVYGRNVVYVGIALGLAIPLVIMAVFRLLDRKKKP